jgi:TrbL/VirB6 plasmid conjugal transfer protein
VGALGNLPGDIPLLIQAIDRLIALIWPLLHFNQVIAALLNDSLGLLLRFWFQFLWSTTNFDNGREFTKNATITLYEPAVQLVADGLLTLVAIWASYRIMWGHGLRSQYTARVLLPRLFMAAVLINFSQPMFQAVVDANNTLCDVIHHFGTIPDKDSWASTFKVDPTDGMLQVITMAVLAVGYDVLAIAYLIRYTILILLAITAPLAGLLFVLPETNHLAKMWRKLFVTNLFMQPVQLFVLAIGFALESNPRTPVQHLFALASLLVVFKVPGAMGSAEKVAHKLGSTIDKGLHHAEHLVVRAI